MSKAATATTACCQYGYSGDVMKNMHLQFFCLHCTLKPKPEFKIVTAMPMVEDPRT
jgi:hypothetical protein